MDFSSTEIVGYLASLIVLISFLMKNIKTLRIINSIGCVLFVAYGILLNFSIPIVITNVAIVAINIYYLVKVNKTEN
ncbi:MAG: uroporphyrinogen decarboxylase [Bacteroidetes bacterium]|nr:uroporphyrinogen decarboxylase [Bacteroidota bacterium]